MRKFETKRKIQFSSEWLRAIDLTDNKILVGSLCRCFSCFSVSNRRSFSDHSIQIFNEETLELVGTLYGHTNNVMTIVADSCRVFSGDHDGVVRLWNFDFEIK